MNWGPESQVASAFTLPNSLAWPDVLLSASFFSAAARYDAGSFRSGSRAAVFASRGTEASWARVGSTRALATE